MWMQMERAAFEELARLAAAAGRNDLSLELFDRLRCMDRQTDMRISYLLAARRLYQQEGGLEFDDDAVVSPGSDPGAYVMGWRWVERGDVKPEATAHTVKSRS